MALRRDEYIGALQVPMIVVHVVHVGDPLQHLLEQALELLWSPLWTIVDQAHQVMKQVLEDHVDLVLLPLG